MQPLIEMTDIVKTYLSGDLEQIVLKGINLKVFNGEQISIMGASGSGKTTLMNIVGMLDGPTSGSYFLNGTNVTTLSADERSTFRNKAIGFVFQSFFLLPRLTILDNVGLPLYYRRCPEAERHERSMVLLNKVGLGQFAKRRPGQLSGGQQQRAAIARSLVGNPSFLLADEPTGALDTATGQMIMDLFVELNQKEKATIIIVTHDPHIAEQCQRTVHIQDGKFVE
jgi:putative ABC transport system ATP-binding protein